MKRGKQLSVSEWMKIFNHYEEYLNGDISKKQFCTIYSDIKFGKIIANENRIKVEAINKNKQSYDDNISFLKKRQEKSLKNEIIQNISKKIF
ncbi:hypothetical protein MNF30_00530 [Mycoplasma mycoides subsp. capri]|uniref:hypothetical protein n=1 Tax=Mycoplasma mycoides TaxID=2102 RepID=UPI002240DB9C|nr:hypothetical protein [Mycoplasma mycoides]UZK64299.1 hypothetical protein MNF30_00530 [Mycoplasma mycoides subsp. capri]